MRTFIAVILAGASGVVSAANVRGIELGDTCKKALDLERNAGLHAAFDLDQTEAQSAIVFKDTREPGQVTSVLYACAGPERTVASYTITTWTKDEAAARMIFETDRGSLARQMGAPRVSSESAPPDKKAAFDAITAKYFQYNEILWFGVESGPHATVEMTLLNKSDMWIVTVDVRSGPILPPNNRIERPREP